MSGVGGSNMLYTSKPTTQETQKDYIELRKLVNDRFREIVTGFFSLRRFLNTLWISENCSSLDENIK